MRKFILTALLIPFIALLSWILQINSLRTSGQKIMLAIAGYDPRDLLAGHYLQYQVRYGDRIACSYDYNANTFCACLSRKPEGLYEADKLSDCTDAGSSSCPLYIKGNCQYGRFTAGIERYHFPEEYSQKLRSIPPESVLEISLDSSGQALVNEIYVKGEKLLDYARKLQQ